MMPQLASPPVSDLQGQIEDLWARRDELAGNPEARELVYSVIARLDRGEERVAELVDGEVVVHEWLKKAILLMFSLSAMKVTELGPFEWVDKIPLKQDYSARGVRVVPPATARFGAFVDRGAIMMPCYVNIGARVGANTMVDTWATVGSCAQIGENVHLSGGVGIGGVLEPPQAAPVFIEDNCLIGSRSMVTQGAHVKQGAVLGEGVILNPGIPVIDAQTGEEVGRGVVPPYSICVQAGRKREFPGGEFTLPCVLILRRYEPGERTHLNEILREQGVNVA
jgi:2,3,4,5-tetrahydropyridine-2-carboxylate N-succinyltransferase